MDPGLEDKVLAFIKSRSHEDGGYTLYEGLPDSKNTYYAIKSFQLLNKEPWNLEKTLDWLEDVIVGVHSPPRDYSTGATYSKNTIKTIKYLKNSLGDSKKLIGNLTSR